MPWKSGSSAVQCPEKVLKEERRLWAEEMARSTLEYEKAQTCGERYERLVARSERLFHSSCELQRKAIALHKRALAARLAKSRLPAA